MSLSKVANSIVIAGALVLAGVLGWSVVSADDWTAEQAVALAVGVGGLLVTLVGNVLRDTERQREHQNLLQRLDAERENREKERESERRREWVDKSLRGMIELERLLVDTVLDATVSAYEAGMYQTDDDLKKEIVVIGERRNSSLGSLAEIALGHPDQSVRHLARNTRQVVQEAVDRYAVGVYALLYEYEFDREEQTRRHQNAREHLAELNEALHSTIM